MTYTTDSMQSFTNGMASGYRDKPFAGLYPGAGFVTDWLSKAAIYRIPEDCFRKGYSWVGTEQQITALEQLERKHKIQQKKRDALALSRLDGEAYLYFDTGDSPGSEINLERITVGKLRFVNLLRRDQVTMGENETDPLSAYFGQPRYYEVSGRSSGAVRIHPSRIARFRNFPNPETGLGNSVLFVVGKVISDANTARDNVVCLTTQARVWVMSLKDLWNNVQDEEGAAMVQKRYQLMSQLMSTNSIAAIDLDGEKFEQRTTSFATLPEIIEAMRREVAAALEIPYALLFGRQGGLGTNGETDLQEYYDNVSVIQRNDVDGPCEILDEVIIRSATGVSSGEVFKEWRSLWEMSDREKAEIAKMFAEAASTAVNSGIMTADMLTDSLANQWIESGVFPGLEQDMAGAKERIRAESEQSEDADDVIGRTQPQDLPEEV